jgi:hypothetical protein
MCITYLISKAVKARRQRKAQGEGSQQYGDYSNARPAYAPSQQYQQQQPGSAPQYQQPAQQGKHHTLPVREVIGPNES